MAAINQTSPMSGPATVNGGSPPDHRRRGSFSFLRRNKSRERGAERSVSGGLGDSSSGRRVKSLTKEEVAQQQRQAQIRQEQQKQPPRLPSYQVLPRMNAPFNTTSNADLAENYHHPPNSFAVTPSRQGYNPNNFYQRQQGQMDRSAASNHNVLVPPPTPENEPSMVDPHARTGSMKDRGRYSYNTVMTADFPNSPRRLRRRKDPVAFNVLVIGTKSCGKTSFVEFLQSAVARPLKQRLTPSPPQASSRQDANSPFIPHYLETELDGERVGLTVYDSKGLERHLVDLQLREMLQFIEQKFEETFREEQKVLRSTGIKDTHIHCVLLLLDPARLDANASASSMNYGKARNGADGYAKSKTIGGLDHDLDVDVLKMLQGKVTVIPVISKADTITTAHMAYLKRTVSDSLTQISIDPLEALNVEADSESEYDDAASAIRRYDDLNGRASSQYDDGRNGDDNTDDTVDRLVDRTSQAQINAYSEAAISGQHLESSAATTRSDVSATSQQADVRMNQISDTTELPLIPLSIISPDIHDPGTVGRRFPWGFADPYNVEHCDFNRLRDNVFGEWRNELREAAREKWYEGWRTNRLNERKPVATSNRYTARNVAPVGRAVSGAEAYGAPSNTASARSVSNGAPVSRSLSTGEIGVAIGNGEMNS